VTTSMRSKEEAFDYRYFPEPDIPPLEPDPAWVERLRADLPELPAARRMRYERDLGLKPDVARVLSASGSWARFFEQAIDLGADPTASANQITQDLAGLLNRARIELAASKVTPAHIADLVRLLGAGTISSAGAKQALEAAFDTGKPIEDIVQEKDLTQVSDAAELAGIVDEVIAENPEPVERFRGGNEGVLGFLVGQLMKKTGGSANPKLAGELLRERLSG
jgi:aspartyl-tRNA(Asn)/glutamyl-tRNA(Gln) amidotransferase subunit B